MSKKILSPSAIEMIEKQLAMGDWLCGDCLATGDSGVELLFDYSGNPHCPECSSPDIGEPEEEEEDEGEEDEEEEDTND
jgi:hypothetical protein